MNKKALVAAIMALSLLPINSLANNEAKKLETMKDFKVEIDKDLDKNNLKDYIKLSDGTILKFGENGELLEFDRLSSKSNPEASQENFEDYLNTISKKLQNLGYITSDYKMVDRQDILDNGIKLVYERQNPYNIKNPYDIIVITFDKNTNTLETFKRIEKFHVTKEAKISEKEAREVASKKVSGNLDEKSTLQVVELDTLPVKYTDRKGYTVAYLFKSQSNTLYVDANDKTLLGMDSSKDIQHKKFATNRISGKDRKSTAIEISKNYFETSDNVILANANNFADSLSASILSKKHNAPILLTDGKKLDDQLSKEIDRLKSSQFIKIGGEKSISAQFELELEKKIKKSGEFVGKDRYETNSQIIKQFKDSDTCIIASGENFADSLSIGSFASQHGYPIVLVQKDKIPETIKNALKESKITKCYIIGGENSVSKSLEKDLPKIIERIAGKDRYETSVKIAEKLFPNSKSAFLASGEVFADSLVVNTVAAMKNTPVILTQKEKLPEITGKYLQKSNIEQITIAGGKNTVSDKIEGQLSNTNSQNISFNYKKDGKQIKIKLSEEQKEEFDKLLEENKTQIKSARYKSVYENYFTVEDENSKENYALGIIIRDDEIEIDDQNLAKGAILKKDNPLAQKYIEFIQKITK